MPRIPQAAIDAMIGHAREALPNEACGAVNVIGASRFVVERIRNVKASPYRYEMDPDDLYRLMRHRWGVEVRRRVPKGQPGAGRFLSGVETEELFAFYHSHVSAPARPSPTDVRQAFLPPGEIDGHQVYGDVFYIVISLGSDLPDVRAYHIRPASLAGRTFKEAMEEAIQEEPIEVVP